MLQPVHFANVSHALFDVSLACGDHLVSDLDEERGHSLTRVVVLTDTMNHLHSCQ